MKLRWVACATLYLLWFGWPLAVRPLVLANGRPAQGEIRQTAPKLFKVRCLVSIGTMLGSQKARLYTYTTPAGCDALKTGATVKIHLFNVGPLYWIALDDDRGFYRFQWAVELGIVLPLTLLVVWYALYGPRRHQSSKLDAFLELLRNA